MIDSDFGRWTLTIVFAATGMWFLIGHARLAGSAPTAAVGRISDIVHASASAVMIAMIWPWGARLPAWPQALAFLLAACWFLAPLVGARLRSTRQPQGLRWSSQMHHTAMALALTWMSVRM